MSCDIRQCQKHIQWSSFIGEILFLYNWFPLFLTDVYVFILILSTQKDYQEDQRLILHISVAAISTFNSWPKLIKAWNLFLNLHKLTPH